MHEKEKLDIPSKELAILLTYALQEKLTLVKNLQGERNQKPKDANSKTRFIQPCLEHNLW